MMHEVIPVHASSLGATIGKHRIRAVRTFLVGAP